LGTYTSELPHPHRYKYEFGLSLQDVEKHLRERPMTDLLQADKIWVPDEVWITSIMTYWWESTRDTVRLVKRLFPKAKVRVGGIYPTLAPHHLRSALMAEGFDFEVVRGRDLEVSEDRGQKSVRNGDCIVTGEVPQASECDLDFEGYRHMTRDLYGEERLPKYAILM